MVLPLLIIGGIVMLAILVLIILFAFLNPTLVAVIVIALMGFMYLGYRSSVKNSKRRH